MPRRQCDASLSGFSDLSAGILENLLRAAKLMPEEFDRSDIFAERQTFNDPVRSARFQLLSIQFS